MCKSADVRVIEPYTKLQQLEIRVLIMSVISKPPNILIRLLGRYCNAYRIYNTYTNGGRSNMSTSTANCVDDRPHIDVSSNANGRN